MIRCIAHLCFITPNLDAIEEFYCNKLGLKRAFEFRNAEGKRNGFYIHAGERNFLEFFQGNIQPPAKGRAYQHLCLEVTEFDATVAELRRRGVEVANVKMGGDQSWQAWINDPDGNAIELHGYTDKSWQAPSLK
jgi:catechol 2,3-dioxygenase-like lactoylglutathione lyase family enzyme